MLIQKGHLNNHDCLNNLLTVLLIMKSFSDLFRPTKYIMEAVINIVAQIDKRTNRVDEDVILRIIGSGHDIIETTKHGHNTDLK